MTLHILIAIACDILLVLWLFGGAGVGERGVDGRFDS